MARAAVKAKQAQRAKAQPAKAAGRRGRRKHSGGGNPNQQLFFSRLRRSAKVAYVILAVLFALTFAFLGVGSGSSGLDQLFCGINIFGGGSGGTSVSKALKEVQKHPSDPEGLPRSRHGVRGEGRHRERDHRAPAVHEAEAEGREGVERARRSRAHAGAEPPPPITRTPTRHSSSPRRAPPSCPPASSARHSARTRSSRPRRRRRTPPVRRRPEDRARLRRCRLAYQKVAKLQPNNANAQFQLAQAAQQAGQSTVAVTAYKAFLKLNPTSSSAAQIRALIKQLSPAPAKPAKKKKTK